MMRPQVHSKSVLTVHKKVNGIELKYRIAIGLHWEMSVSALPQCILHNYVQKSIHECIVQLNIASAPCSLKIYIQ